ncbi:MAG: hypothetical protein QM817_32680 [Archangium sp.]
MRLLRLAFFLALACSPPPTPDCMRSQVSSDGFINGAQGGFGGGVIGGGTGGGFGTSVQVRLPGEPITLRMVAPLTSCATDDLRVSVEVLGPDSQPIEHTDTQLQRAADFHVEISTTFTPQEAGTFVARAVFEPSLGVRTTSLNILHTWEGQGTPVAIPASVSCSKALWPVTSSSVACESMNEVISVVSSDGGVSSFVGHGLVAVGDVLWSETLAGNLERRVPDADGGFTITNSWTGFGSTPIRGLHTRTTAVRRKNVGNSVATAVVIDGGTVDGFFSSSDLDTAYFFYEHDQTVRVAGGFSCSGCLQSVVGFDNEVVWQQFGVGSVLSGFKRPITEMTQFRPPQQSLNVFARTSVAPLEPLERWPLWVDPADRQALSILIHPRSGALNWTVWPRARVVRVGAEHVLISTDAGVVVAPIEP